MEIKVTTSSGDCLLTSITVKSASKAGAKAAIRRHFGSAASVKFLELKEV